MYLIDVEQMLILTKYLSLTPFYMILQLKDDLETTWWQFDLGQGMRGLFINDDVFMIQFMF